MLSAIAGPDDRAPLSYDVDTSQFARAVKAPVDQGLADRLDAGSRRAASRRRGGRRGGAERDRTCSAASAPGSRPPVPDFSEVTDIVRGTRAAIDGRAPRRQAAGVARATCRRIWSGHRAGPGADAARRSRAASVLRSALWQRVRDFMATPRAARAADGRGAAVSGRAAVPDRDQRQDRSTTTRSGSRSRTAITLTGLPAISVPCGFTRSGLPVGLQIVGRRRQEAAVLRAAAAFEAAAPWAAPHPTGESDALVSENGWSVRRDRSGQRV